MWSMYPQVSTVVQAWLEVRCTVDRFASVEHHLLPRFNVKWFAGWEQGRSAEAVDALVQDWSQEENWCNAPFGMLGRVLAYASYQQAQGLVVVPSAPAWRYAPWWSRVFAEDPPTWVVDWVDLADVAAAEGLPAEHIFRSAGRPGATAVAAVVIRFDFEQGDF